MSISGESWQKPLPVRYGGAMRFASPVATPARGSTQPTTIHPDACDAVDRLDDISSYRPGPCVVALCMYRTMPVNRPWYHLRMKSSSSPAIGTVVVSPGGGPNTPGLQLT
jgi:hypothetical protein